MTDTNAMAEQRRARAPHTAAFLRSRPRNPYRVPRPAVISFSGGRTSAYMLRRVIDAYGGRLPEDISVIFSNTGMERPETLEFVDVCAHAWSVQVQWVEYFWDAPHRTRLVDYTAAARNGEPYAALIDRKGFVPNVTLRACSGTLHLYSPPPPDPRRGGAEPPVLAAHGPLSRNCGDAGIAARSRPWTIGDVVGRKLDSLRLRYEDGPWKRVVEWLLEKDKFNLYYNGL